MKKTALYTLPLTLLSTSLSAGLVDSLNARTQGVGGAGVASSYGTAAFRENPANILSDKYTFDLGLNISASVTGAEETLDDLDDLSLEADNLDQAIDAASGAPTLTAGGFTDPRYTDLSNAAGSFASVASRLEGDFFSADLGLQFGFSVSGEDSDWAYGAVLGSSLEIIALADNLDQDLSEVQLIADALSDGTVTSSELTAISNTSFADQVGSGIEFTLDSFANESKTEGRAIFAAYGETGITLARRIDLLGQTLVIGVTPKIVNLVAAEVNERVQDFDSDTIDEDDLLQEETFFSADVGVRYESFIADLVFAGSIHNLIGGEVETDIGASTVSNPTPTKVELKPKLTVGVAKPFEYFSLAADLDLTEQELVVGGGRATQFLSIGAEMDLKRWLSLRAGYQTNLASDSSIGNSFSVGFGLLKNVVQLAGTVGEDDQYGVSLDISLQF